MRLLLALLAACCAPAWAQQQDIQRSLIQRDQQSAEFAAQVKGGAEARAQLEALHARQLGQADSSRNRARTSCGLLRRSSGLPRSSARYRCQGARVPASIP
jgi:hypothetical protein